MVLAIVNAQISNEVSLDMGKSDHRNKRASNCGPGQREIFRTQDRFFCLDKIVLGVAIATIPPAILLSTQTANKFASYVTNRLGFGDDLQTREIATDKDNLYLDQHLFNDDGSHTYIFNSYPVDISAQQSNADGSYVSKLSQTIDGDGYVFQTDMTLNDNFEAMKRDGEPSHVHISYGAAPGHRKTNLDFQQLHDLYLSSVTPIENDNGGLSVFCGVFTNSGDWQGWFAATGGDDWSECTGYIQSHMKGHDEL